MSLHGLNKTQEFQSTLPSRGATMDYSQGARNVVFQSTLPSRGATRQTSRNVCARVDFNPRSPRGERPVLFRSHLP